MIILIILIGLFWPSSVFAAPQISITNLPSEVFSFSTFPVNFLVTNAGIGISYYYKFFGGIGDSTSTIKTSVDLSYNSSWVNFPKFTSDLGASAIISASAYIIPEAIEGIHNFKIRIAMTTNTSSGTTSPNYPLNVILLEPSTTPIITPTPIDSPKPTAEEVTPLPTHKITPTISPNPTATGELPLIISEIMANSNTGENEWIEIYNPTNQIISLKNSCFYDASLHFRCFPETAVINPNSYYSHSFTSGFLNNDGDKVTFQNKSIIYPKSPKNVTYSRQENNSWCFAESSRNINNNNCFVTTQVSSENNDYVPPLLTLQFSPDSVTAGDDFNLVFSLNSSDSYFLRLISPFGSQYFPFNNFKDGYSWLSLPLSVSKKLPAGEYPLFFHLKKAGSSHLYDYQLGKININHLVITPKVSKSKVLGISTYSCPDCPDNSSSVNYLPATTLKKVRPDNNFFSWPFLFAGSILFLSPILFPKLYSD
ncbi:MAG: lamin tail domain-containing protein [Candidatus Shapirobacteria bacterium]